MKSNSRQFSFSTVWAGVFRETIDSSLVWLSTILGSWQWEQRRATASIKSRRTPEVRPR